MSDAPSECSRAGCRDAAVWAIRWRNPRIHTPDRRKTWVACPAHVGYLREFLAARDFPLEVVALDDDRQQDAGGALDRRCDGTRS